ncbi:hypothetical protein FHU10_3651 [Serratia fonticola]|uniref:Uncharacterized protein n=1 Tax=Serratia fonticola TaxID=47917 RepID=A0A542D0E3_SERFO|nr:hypothetical protein FHU09_4055 [Serratia fonticola]TQI96548.1 hypothetical protein FHU11_1990 [Serratia fonticola]TVZ71045.1 hypothetical protein FHU10_3651 [Serratia fonticola]
MAYVEYIAFCPHCDISLPLKRAPHTSEKGVGHCQVCKKKFTLIFRKSTKKPT